MTVLSVDAAAELADIQAKASFLCPDHGLQSD